MKSFFTTQEGAQVQILWGLKKISIDDWLVFLKFI